MRIIEEIDEFKLMLLVDGRKRWVGQDLRGLLEYGEYKDFSGDEDPMIYHPSRWDYERNKPIGAPQDAPADKQGATTTAATVCERFGLDAAELGEPALWLRAKGASAQLAEEIEEALAEKLKAENAARKASKPAKNSKAAREAARLEWRTDINLLEARRALVGLRAAKEIAEAFTKAAGTEAGLIERES
jgi:hypothetical protein